MATTPTATPSRLRTRTHTSSNFDLLGELTSKILPDGTLTETRQYDQNGNLSSITHFNGVTTTYTYDSLNRLLSSITPGETAVSHTYTGTGKYLTTTDASGTTTYSYDNMDRLTGKATPEGTLNYTYDAAGHVASIASSNPNGASVSYTYDDLNRLSTVVDNRLVSGANTTTYTYDPASNVATVTYPNAVQTLFQYDTLNRVAGLATQQTGYLYQRGSTGNLTQATELNGRTVNWSYDGIYRLTNETISLDPAKHNGSVSYGLDPVGNRLSENSTLSGINSGTFGLNADDQLFSETYDANGNVTAASGKTFSYDSENHMVGVNGGAVRLVYDGFGNRVAKTVNGVTTKYLIEDDVNPTGYPQVFDELANGVVTRTYTYGLQRISQEQVVNNTWTTSFYGYDGGGSVRQLTNSTGAITDTYEYDAYGNLLNSTGTTPNVYKYRGEAYDSDLGLYYLRARWMNPITGRFMSRDPYDGYIGIPVTLHKYLYAGSDPVNHVDPRGRFLAEYALENADAVPEAKLVSIYGCIADASLAAVDLLLDKEIGGSTALSVGSTVVGCVLLTPGLDELAEAGNKIVKSADFLSKAAGWGACALSAEDFINALNGVLSGKSNPDQIGKSIESLGGCVGDALGQMIAKE
jgi:RHS repeat-associated protein